MTGDRGDAENSQAEAQARDADESAAALFRAPGYIPWFIQDTMNKSAVSGWMFFVPLIVLAISGNEALSGAVLGLGTLIVTVVGLFGGTLVDRVNRRVALFAYAGGQAVVWITVTVLLLENVLAVWMLVAAIVVISIISGLFRAASGALLRSIVPSKQLPRAFANNQARDAVIELGAAPVVGVLFGIGSAFAVAFSAAANAVAFGAVATIKQDVGEIAASGKTFMTDLVGGFTWLGQHLQIVRSTLILALGNFALTLVITALQIHYFQRGYSAFVIGFIFTGAAVGMLLGSVLASASISRLPVGRILVWSLIAVTAGTSILGFVPNSVWVTVIAMGFVGFVLPFVNSGIGGWTYSQIPKGFQGRVGGVSKLIFGLATALAPVAAGLALTRASFQMAISISCVSFLVALLLTLFSPSIRSIGKPDDWSQTKA